MIRILEVGQLFRDEHALTVTTSPAEAGDFIRTWLEEIVNRAGGPPPDNGTPR